jgi:hypothetical protein
MRITSSFLSAVLLMLGFSLAAFGQGDSSIGSFSFNIPPAIKGMPYSAEQVTENVQTLADGNKITRTSKSRQFRDSEGRTRNDVIEQPNLPPEVANRFSFIRISDPITGYTYTFSPSTKTATRRKIIPPAEFPRPTTPRAPVSGYNSRSEDLGSRTIDGIETTGRRFIITIAPGTVGNEKAIETVSESWYSSLLRIMLLNTNSDPRTGVSTTRTINIKRDEPDKSLFEIPADYKIIDQDIPRAPSAP